MTIDVAYIPIILALCIGGFVGAAVAAAFAMSSVDKAFARGWDAHREYLDEYRDKS